MHLKNDEFALLHAFIDKEIIPYACEKPNKRYGINHIRWIVINILGLEVTSGLIANLLRQRGIAEKQINGSSHFAISSEFFYENL